MYENIDEVDFADKLAGNNNAVLLDVRTSEEWDAGFIAGAEKIDFFNPEFPKLIEELDKKKDYFVYCRSGNRSGKACDLMASLGFTGVLHNLDGGIMGWTGELEY
ncbi:MAG: rhodanese-like domain-containing protein [Reichenbachiella sp.]